MFKIGKILIASLFFILLFPKLVFATFSFSVTEVTPTSVNSKNQEIQVKILVNSLPAGDSYFRIGLENGSTSLGYLKNNNDNWIKLGTLSYDKENNLCVNYYKISADGEYLLLIKIGDDNEISNGSHAIKAYRFTSTCLTSSDSSETPNLSVNIILPTPTPTPTPDPTAISTPTPSSTPSPSLAPSRSPLTPSPSPTPTPTKKLTPIAKQQALLIPSPLAASSSSTAETEFVLAAATTLIPTATPTVSENKSSNNFLPIILVGAGLLFLTVSGVLLFKTSRDRYT